MTVYFLDDDIIGSAVKGKDLLVMEQIFSYKS